jgi:septum formation protein
MMALADVDLVLASTSRYRRELLSRLTTHFRTLAPQVDELRLPDEAPAAMAERLANAKAADIAVRTPGAVVIGSDQVADLDGRVLGKPGDARSAWEQLAACSGRQVIFHTALCLIDGRGGARSSFMATDTTRVHFRVLGAEEIARYIEREQPFDCAGSFKAEALGVALFDRIESSDPTGLIGLPLIALCRLLRDAAITVF